MVLSDVVKQGTAKLVEAGISDATVDAFYLFEYVFGLSRVEYLMESNKEASLVNYDRYNELIEKRCKHIPLQHITGVQEFMGYNFHVNEHVLIPRQDTECLVEAMLPYVSDKKVLDICTGSGCIIISLSKIKSLKKADAVDISNDALIVAKKNAKQLGADVCFIESDLFSHIEGKYDIIVSNPPYIPTKVIEGLMEEVRIHEPMIALDGKEDGLYFYQKIIKEAPKYLEQGGRIFFEIGCEQGQAVKALLEEEGFCDVIVKQDLAGLDRIVMGKWK